MRVEKKKLKLWPISIICTAKKERESEGWKVPAGLLPSVCSEEEEGEGAIPP